MLKHTWRLILNLVLAAGLLLSFFVGVELVRGFILFHRINPVFGWIYLGLLASLVLFLLITWIRQWAAFPRPLKPPVLPPDPAQASFRDLRRFCLYLVRYLQRLAANQRLTREEADAAAAAVEDLKDALHAHPLRDDLLRAIEAAETETILPLLARLDRIAEEEVRHSVRDVMLGVTLSPLHSVDMLIVLYRNGAMILRLVRIYASRPSPRDQLLILRDTLRVVATVNLLNLGRTLLEALFSSVPVIGRVIDDIAQGIGAGLLTSATGHAAMTRCAAFRAWNEKEATESLAGHAVQFFADVKDIFAKDILPALKSRIRSVVPAETADAPGFWESVIKGVARAIDATATAIGSYVIQPAVAGTTGVVRASYRATRQVVRAGSNATRHTARAGSSAFRGISRVFRTFGQRIKYSVRGPRP